ncbi:hypothetical protein ACP70R_036228 [Stipagrostis hirtigluma subsp. patula]
MQLQGIAPWGRPRVSPHRRRRWGRPRISPRRGRSPRAPPSSTPAAVVLRPRALDAPPPSSLGPISGPAFIDARRRRPQGPRAVDTPTTTTRRGIQVSLYHHGTEACVSFVLR